MVFVAALCWMVGVPVLASPGDHGAPASLFVYAGAGCTGRKKVSRFEAYLGRPVDGVTDFMASQSWDDMERSLRWALGCWKPMGRRLALAVPMLPKEGATLTAGAAGEYDHHFASLGRAMVELGAADAFLRVGVEFNGDWFPWAARRDPVAFKVYFARIARILRATPGARFQIVWNPGLGALAFPADRAYPGDESVDVIGLDVYNQTWEAADREPAARWKRLREQPFGLDWLRRFAAAHRKRIALPEWGTGTRPDGHGAGDDPLFIERMAAWIRGNDVVFQSYWDYPAPDYNARLSDGQYPASARAFRSAFARTDPPGVMPGHR